ncbi:hypothetical protein [Catenulispora rubra]|uniref:hypothetical protein n=1 Tax=Catenulispora rubra TaxID=280293 RepID=UPI001891FD9F|nr:hypothetical protein [Catenulispora rubra]
MFEASTVWQQRLSTILPAGHRVLPDGEDTAETIIAMADEWSQLGGRFQMIARSGNSLRKPVYVSDDFCRRFPRSTADRASFEPHRSQAMANLLIRLAMHAAARCPEAGPDLVAPYLRYVDDRYRWSALTCDVGALAIAVLDVQLTGSPTIALWYLNQVQCMTDHCLAHQPPPADGRWQWPDHEAVSPLAWQSMPALAWLPGVGTAAELDPTLPEAQAHPFFAAAH